MNKNSCNQEFLYLLNHGSDIVINTRTLTHTHTQGWRKREREGERRMSRSRTVAFNIFRTLNAENPTIPKHKLTNKQWIENAMLCFISLCGVVWLVDRPAKVNPAVWMGNGCLPICPPARVCVCVRVFDMRHGVRCTKLYLFGVNTMRPINNTKNYRWKKKRKKKSK